MARLLSLEDCSVKLRNHLLASLRELDEGVLLPQAERNDATGAYKNIVFRLHGSDAAPPADVFAPNWYTGVSMIRLKSADADRILARAPEDVQATLDKLVASIPSECADSSLRVGPELDCDSDDRDAKEWVAGFDGPGCCVGLYSAEHSAAPDPSLRGMNRVHAATYLVCKAGAGLAGATFQARLQAACRRGASLNQSLEQADGDPGPQALRRVEKAGSRNRARILLLAAEALGLRVDTVPDQSSRGRYRLAVTTVDVTANCLRKAEATGTRPCWQYSTCVDATASTGLCTLSNAADGVVLLLSDAGEVRFKLGNGATFSTVPFATRQLLPETELVQRIAEAHRRSLADGGRTPAHPDAEFVYSRFGWAARKFGTAAEERGVVVEPLPLWGSHEAEDWLASYAREMGVASCQVVRLRPRLVAIAAVEQGKLRALMRNLSVKAGDA